MKKVRWGVIGTGGIADRRTIPGLLKAKNSVLTAVMDVDFELAKKIQNKYGAKKAYRDCKELVEDTEVDAVYIATPVYLHTEQAKIAADLGKPILLEKPLALTAKESEKLVRYFAKKSILFGAGFMMRFGAHVQNMKKILSLGKIGSLVSIYAQFTCWYPKRKDAWRQDKSKSGGGALMDLGIHCIDLIRYITGGEIEDLCALQDNLTFHYNVEDSSTLLFHVSNGAHGVIQSNFNIPDEAAKWRIEIFGTKGRLIGNNVIGQQDGGTLEAVFTGKSKNYNSIQNKQNGDVVNITGNFKDLYAQEIESFADSVLHHKPLKVPASEAVIAQKLIESAYSVNSGKKTGTA